MSCHTTNQDLLQLHCSFPENIKKLKAFAAYFIPRFGKERLIGKCTQMEDLECDYETGFSGKIHTDGIRATITLPGSFDQEYGQFRCDVPGLPDVKSCQWSPPATTPSAGTIKPTENSIIPGERGTVTYDAAIGTGATVAIAAVILIAIAVIFLYRKNMTKKRKRPRISDSEIVDFCRHNNGQKAFPNDVGRQTIPLLSPSGDDQIRHTDESSILRLATKASSFLRKRKPSSGSRSEFYRHSVTEAHAALLTGRKSFFQDIKRNTGADVEFDPNPSDVQSTKTLIIRGSKPFQIEKAVEFISRETGTQETISAQAQTFWQQWVEAAFPDLDSRAYFLPSVYFKRVPMIRQLSGGLEVMVLDETPTKTVLSTPEQGGQSLGKTRQSTPVQPNQSNQPGMNPSQNRDIRSDAAMQWVLFCLRKMSEENREVLVGLSQLQFGQYLGEPCYAAAAAHLPVPKSLPAALSKNKQGDFNVLLIHRQYGIVVCEVNAFIEELDMSQQDIDENIRSHLTQAVSQLDKAEAMLAYLVSDVTPGLRITKTIAVPNLTACQVQQAISGDTKLMQKLSQCFGTPADPVGIAAMCLCSAQLPDHKTPWDVRSDVLRELGNWWQRRVAVSGPDSHMTCDSYKTLVARFCGPATTVTVPCTSPPRLCVKTLGQAVSWTGECYTAQITLFPEQVRLINMKHSRRFVAGPPGTGKTVMLLLMATEWLGDGNDVCIVGSCKESRAACSMLYHLLLQIVNTQLKSVKPHGQPRLLQYEFYGEKDVEKAVNDLSLEAKDRSLCVIADEACQSDNFKTFCDKLLTQVPDLHLWAASCFHAYAPAGWHVEYLTRPLRSPPAVVREVQQDVAIADGHRVKPYSERGVADHTDGPQVKQLYHKSEGHSGLWAGDCVTCGREVASFLHSLRFPGHSTTSETVPTISSSTTPPCLQWRDVFVLCRHNASDQLRMAKGLREANIPLQVMKNDDIEDVATARSDVVWMAQGNCVHGLERKVVVCLDAGLFDVRLFFMSRCTSQLVIVS